ncbi:MAG: hypothetical protein ACRES7_11935 [Gammaproteobacteria bacterium]
MQADISRSSVAGNHIQIEQVLLHFPHLNVASVTRAVLMLAAEIGAHDELRMPDAIMFALPIELGATLEATKDRIWRKTKELDILLLSELAGWALLQERCPYSGLALVD